MSIYSNQISAKMGAVIDGYIDIKTATTVPESSDLKLEKNQGFMVDATYIYADLVGSSTLAQQIKKPIVAKIIRAYINGSADILRHYGGEIRSFDGDRVMAIFMGLDKETKAVRAALAINWLVQSYLAPKVSAAWENMDSYWTVDHSVGVDTGEALITRGGVRGDNDLISIGPAPNIAAKLSDIRSDGYKLHITSEVYTPMENSVAFTEEKDYFGVTRQVQMWHKTRPTIVGGRTVQVMGSNYFWEPE